MESCGSLLGLVEREWRQTDSGDSRSKSRRVRPTPAPGPAPWLSLLATLRKCLRLFDAVGAGPGGGIRRYDPETRGPRRAEAKAPFPNAVGRKPPLTQRRSGSSAPFIEDDLRPTDVRERPGALAGARARRSRRGPRRGRPLSPRRPRRPCSKEPPEMGRTRMGFSAGAGETDCDEATPSSQLPTP